MKINIKGKELTISEVKELCNILKCKPKELKEDDFEILTDEEAQNAAVESIKDTIWAFNQDFVRWYLKDGVSIEAYRACANLYENGNTACLSLIEDVDALVEDAIRCDGRGHFLNTYDHNEYEVGYYFVYRR